MDRSIESNAYAHRCKHTGHVCVYARVHCTYMAYKIKLQMNLKNEEEEKNANILQAKIASNMQQCSIKSKFNHEA